MIYFKWLKLELDFNTSNSCITISIKSVEFSLYWTPNLIASLNTWRNKTSDHSDNSCMYYGSRQPLKYVCMLMGSFILYFIKEIETSLALLCSVIKHLQIGRNIQEELRSTTLRAVLLLTILSCSANPHVVHNCTQHVHSFSISPWSIQVSKHKIH